MQKLNTRPFLIMIALFAFIGAQAQKQPSAFDIVPLGVKGGLDESNLSSYALAVRGTDQYICLDAGTINFGVQRAIASHVWKGSSQEIIREKIKGYFISHPHLDHLAGLIMNSPDDSKKNIYASAYTIDVMKDKYFSWKSWANFGNEGENPALGTYRYNVLTAGNEVPIENTSMYVTSYSLSHSTTLQSTAFLIRYKENYLLYLGDTGADEIEKSTHLQALWKGISPLIRDKKLKAIFIEVSFANEQPDNLLFGHLTPRLLMNELKVLSQFTGEAALKDFPVVVTHMKPAGNREETIKKQLAESNALQLKLVFAEQGKKISF